MKIFSMADDRRKILDTAYSYSQKIADHVIKCVIYTSKCQSCNHWIAEIANWIEDVNSMRPEKGFKLKPKDYLSNLFVGIGDELPDAKRELQRFYTKYVHGEDYPSFEITYDLYNTVYDAYWEIADKLSVKLGKYDDRTAYDDIYRDVKAILDKYC